MFVRLSSPILASLLVGVAATSAAAQPRVGVLFPGTPEAHALQLERFQARLGTLRRDVLLDVRHGHGDAARLAREAGQLAAGDAKVLVGFTLAPTEALRHATSAASTPLLFVAIGDPVARGLVADLRVPGGRITGSSDLVPEVPRHRMDLLAEVLPGARRVGVVSNAAITPRAPLDAAAARHGMTLLHLDVREAAGFAAAYSAMSSERLDALVVTPNAITFAERHRLAAWARERKLPVMFGWREFMDAGGLLSLGANTGQLAEVAAEQLDQVLRGAPPSTMPVAAPKFDLVVDLRTAAHLGMAVPPGVLARADQVIRGD
ncbi:MAG TPA: ABC transporter substrate-binding protein [Ramlibacter sp.]|nr:ABC transporter substrate-binding protein [Ramlibacter sp.]